MQLTYKNEKPLFLTSLILASIFWLLLIVGSFGIALIYLLLGYMFYLFVQSGFISYVKGSGVKVTEQQMPELYKQFNDCSQKLDMDTPPEFYLLNSDGVLNALATHFLRKKYVVLYSSVLDALKKYPGAINFYIGHELAHIKQGHLKWLSFLWPASLLPVLGTSYSRAREYTCDLHGLYCCNEAKEAPYALAVLAAGPEYWSKVNLKEYTGQCAETGGFWMSFHEYVGDYPWLCKRISHVIEVAQGNKAKFPRRNPLAFILSCFVPRLGVGGAAGGMASLVVVVAIIGILAAIALPAYQDYTVRAKVSGVEAIASEVINNATPYIQANNELPYNLQAIDLPNDLSNDVVAHVEVIDDGFLFELQGHPKLQGETILYVPYLDESGYLYWSCRDGSLELKYRPMACRE